MERLLTWRNLAMEAIEELILWSRYLLIPLYLALLFVILTITLDFFRVLAGLTAAEDLTEHTLRALELLDYTMIANLIWLISAGSYYVFVDNHYPDYSGKKRPRALTHVSSGLLKEKMAGSIVGVSSVYLLELFLHVATAPATVNWDTTKILLAIHLMFILGLLAFNHTNAADHHDHSKEKEKETTDAPH
jgi:uncharacterized protein (TIGR00645 family)